MDIPEEDEWAYTPEHLRRLERALQDSREGRVRRLTEVELDQLVARKADECASERAG